MKIRKLILSAATACFLMGSSNAAMAIDCPLGFIANETVGEINVDTGRNCYISDVPVLGGVTIQNSGEVIIRNTRVFGSVRIEDSDDIGLFDNEVVDGDVEIIRPITAYITDNTLVRSGQRRSMVMRGCVT